MPSIMINHNASKIKIPKDPKRHIIESETTHKNVPNLNDYYFLWALPTPTITHKTQIEPTPKEPKSNLIITNGKPTKPKLNSRPFNNHYKNNKSVTKLDKASRLLRAKMVNVVENARVHYWEVRNYYVGLIVGQTWKKCRFQEGNSRWKVGIIIVILIGNWQKKRKRSKRPSSPRDWILFSIFFKDFWWDVNAGRPIISFLHHFLF